MMSGSFRFSFTSSVSYTHLDVYKRQEQDLSEKYHNRYLEIIFPADRDRVSQEMVSQLEEGRITELEYRLVTEEGKLIWVMDRSILVTEEDGLEYIYTLLVDVTQSHKAMEELQMSVERYKIILDQTKDVIFEWEIATDEISYSSNWEHKYGYQPILDGISRRLPFASHKMCIRDSVGVARRQHDRQHEDNPHIRPVSPDKEKKGGAGGSGKQENRCDDDIPD